MALADPERWAVLHAFCAQCGRCMCDRCIARRGLPVSDLRCTACGGHYRVEDLEKNAGIARGLVEAAWQRRHLGNVAEMLSALELCGVPLTPSESKKRAYCARHSPPQAPATDCSVGLREPAARDEGKKKKWWQFWR